MKKNRVFGKFHFEDTLTVFVIFQGGPEALSESPRCNDMVADLHFPRFSARPLNVK